MPRQALDEVRVDMSNGRKESAPRTSTFVYVNGGFTGSANSVISEDRPEVITGVYREQYCVCTRWPYTQRVLAVAVGVLLGALIGLALSMVLRGEDNPVIGPIFSSGRSVPD